MMITQLMIMMATIKHTLQLIDVWFTSIQQNHSLWVALGCHCLLNLLIIWCTCVMTSAECKVFRSSFKGFQLTPAFTAISFWLAEGSSLQVLVWWSEV